MRLTLVLFGHTLDLSLEPTAEEADDDPATALNGGTLASYPISFTAAYDVPEEVTCPQHCPAWDEPPD